MKKIFFNAFSYNHGGWFICEAHDWPYKNKTDKPVFVIKPHPDDPRGVSSVSDDPEVQVYLQEVDEVRKKLHDELAKVAVDLKLHITNLDGKQYADGEKIEEVLIEDDAEGKKLMDTLIALGWEYQFIPIGP
jgi:hypothetical protein